MRIEEKSFDPSGVSKLLPPVSSRQAQTAPHCWCLDFLRLPTWRTCWGSTTKRSTASSWRSSAWTTWRPRTLCTSRSTSSSARSARQSPATRQQLGNLEVSDNDDRQCFSSTSLDNKDLWKAVRTEVLQHPDRPSHWAKDPLHSHSLPGDQQEGESLYFILFYPDL